MVNPTSKQCARAVLMVAPTDFEFNAETSHDNEFMHAPREPSEVVNRRAMAEFENMVALLRQNGLTVVVPEPRTSGPTTPDAVFPNNWFSTEHDGTLLLYPMAPVSRRLEKRIDALEAALLAQGFAIRNVINVGRFHETEHFLEGTGSLCIDHDRRVVFAARSERCHTEQFENFVALRGYKHGLLFDTLSRTGQPIYHTNVMLSIGEAFAVLCKESIVGDAQREAVVMALGPHREIVDISLAQVEGFCGNIQQVRNALGQPLIVMSQRAYDTFTADQKGRLSRHGKLLPVPLPTIERVGGGSARCMIGEIFLPRRPGA
ncbi:MAG TPA: arginine deiminase-related protein [Myxococcota bacterium]|nr:arginine deiminase-related protein [Myxococcota bacterium]